MKKTYAGPCHRGYFLVLLGQKASADMSGSGDKETSGKWAAFGRYLSGVFVVFTGSSDYWYAGKVQCLSKWIFDVLKNAMVAGTLKFLADKTGFLILRIASDVAFLALLAYVTAYNNTFMFRFFHPLKNQRLAFALDAIVSMAILLPVFLVIYWAIPAAIDAIAKSQGQ
jgi:hypothetical protein